MPTHNNGSSYSGRNADGIGAGGPSDHLTLLNNDTYHNSDDGIDLGDATHCVIDGNRSHDNGEGIKLLAGTRNNLPQQHGA